MMPLKCVRFCPSELELIEELLLPRRRGERRADVIIGDFDFYRRSPTETDYPTNPFFPTNQYWFFVVRNRIGPHSVKPDRSIQLNPGQGRWKYRSKRPIKRGTQAIGYREVLDYVTQDNKKTGWTQKEYMKYNNMAFEDIVVVHLVYEPLLDQPQQDQPQQDQPQQPQENQPFQPHQHDLDYVEHPPEDQNLPPQPQQQDQPLQPHPLDLDYELLPDDMFLQEFPEFDLFIDDIQQQGQPLQPQQDQPLQPPNLDYVEDLPDDMFQPQQAQDQPPQPQPLDLDNFFDDLPQQDQPLQPQQPQQPQQDQPLQPHPLDLGYVEQLPDDLFLQEYPEFDLFIDDLPQQDQPLQPQQDQPQPLDFDYFFDDLPDL